MAETIIGDHGLFADQVFTATDLNRRAGEVLNQARTHPVTISRNNEQFALLKREYAAGLVSAVSHLRNVLTLTRNVHALLAAKHVDESAAWIKAFDAEDLSKMVDELSAATDSAFGAGDWEPVDALIHEWHESALVISSRVLENAMSEPAEPTPLQRPADPGAASGNGNEAGTEAETEAR
jgi:hypothetical protein